MRHAMEPVTRVRLRLASADGDCWCLQSNKNVPESEQTGNNSEVYSTAGRSISAGLTAADVVSKWTWAATLLQSSNVAWNYGVSGPFWYASGATIQVLLFAILAIEIKRKCPVLAVALRSSRHLWRCVAHASCEHLIVPRSCGSFFPDAECIMGMRAGNPHGARGRTRALGDDGAHGFPLFLPADLPHCHGYVDPRWRRHHQRLDWCVPLVLLRHVLQRALMSTTRPVLPCLLWLSSHWCAGDRLVCPAC